MKDEWVINVKRYNLTSGSLLEGYSMRPSDAAPLPYPEIVRLAAYLTEKKYIVCYNPSSIFAVSQALNTQFHIETVWTEDAD